LGWARAKKTTAQEPSIGKPIWLKRPENKGGFRLANVCLKATVGKKKKKGPRRREKIK